MKCPNCNTSLGASVSVTTKPVEITFYIVGVGPGQFNRTSDVAGRELFDIDKITAETHFFNCPKCGQLPATTLVVMPTCAHCGKEKTSMTPDKNTCHYVSGLVCLECQRRRTGDCRGCSRYAKCNLGQRALNPGAKPNTATTAEDE